MFGSVMKNELENTFQYLLVMENKLENDLLMF